MIYAMFMGIMLSSLFLFVVGKVSIRAISRVADIPDRLLLPVVLVLCAYGAFAINNNFFDILVMLGMGIVGFIMLRTGVPAAPFLIAFWILTVLALVLTIRRGLASRRQSAAT